MYICQECGHELMTRNHMNTYRGGNPRTDTYKCPHCYCPQYDEAIIAREMWTAISPTSTIPSAPF